MLIYLPLTIFHKCCLSRPYLGKYERDWNETWFIDRWQWEEGQCTRTIILPCLPQKYWIPVPEISFCQFLHLYMIISVCLLSCVKATQLCSFYCTQILLACYYDILISIFYSVHVIWDHKQKSQISVVKLRHMFHLPHMDALIFVTTLIYTPVLVMIAV